MFALLLSTSPIAAEARQVIADATPNPSAVQFRKLREGGGVICGEFNAPNKEGGYEGFEPFVFASKDNWFTGLLDGKVMANGKLTDLRRLNERRRGLGTNRHATLQDIEDSKESSAALGASTELLRRCPRVSVGAT